jgi:hypothetical protein
MIYEKSLLCLLALLLVLTVYSCNLFNPTYKFAKEEQQRASQPLCIDVSKIDSTFLDTQDTNILFYKIDAQSLKDIVKMSKQQFTLCVSFYSWCRSNILYFDSVLKFAETTNIKLLVLDEDDWLYQQDSRSFFKEKKYYTPVFILDIHKYGYSFNNRKRWRAFLNELCGDDKKLYGHLDVILFNSGAEILLYGSFFEQRDNISNIIDSNKK